LIGIYNDSLYRVYSMKGIEGYHHLYGGAVRIGDDSLVLFDILRIDFGYDQGDIRVHSKGGTIVNYHGTRLRRYGRVTKANLSACGKQDHIYSSKAMSGDFPYIDLTVVNKHFLSLGTA
jgi:hypothetical protein